MRESSDMTKIGKWSTVLTLVTWISCVKAEPQLDETCLEQLPMIPAAVAAWEYGNAIGLSPAVRTTVLSEFCVSAREVHLNKSVSLERINAVAEPTIWAFLDRSADSGKNDASMTAILKAELGVAGFATPLLKRWGRLDINYRKEVDSMNIDGDSHAPVASYLLESGTHRLSGLKNKNTVCNGEVDVKTSGPVSFDC